MLQRVNLVKNEYKIPDKNTLYLLYHVNKTYQDTYESTITSLLLAFVCANVVRNSLVRQFQDHGHAVAIKDEYMNIW